jgi:polyphosphate kinase
MTQPGLATADDEPVDLFAALHEHDILVHHPYDSFATSVEAFIRQAADDPHVLAIKQTLYRTSGDSPVVKSLIHAAELGKEVAVLVELKARFDEQANIGWARALEEAGVHVVYGLVGLKTHAKAALVVRDEDDGIHRYCHIGTGNYNSKTARLYEDFGLLSADPALGADLTELFNFLTGYSRELSFRKIFLAPVSLRNEVIALIDQQAALGPEGHIVIKINNLADQAIIDALYRASQAGVPIELIVRTVCGLVPGIEGLSETIRVRSILGRYLEHSRIFVFGPPGPDAAYFIGSSDLMPGNLDRRIEAMTPVDSAELKARLQEVIDIDLADDVPAWQLGPEGIWERVAADGVSSQRRLQELALVRARRRRDPDALSSAERV